MYTCVYVSWFKQIKLVAVNDCFGLTGMNTGQRTALNSKALLIFFVRNNLRVEHVIPAGE